MTEHKGLPVKGYTTQSQDKVSLVNENKRMEELIMRQLDSMAAREDCDYVMLTTARINIVQGFMWMNRAVFQPTRIELSEDESGL